MLHICTPVFRYEFLEEIYKTIPEHDDITWHLAKIKSRPDPQVSFLNDKRVKIYQINCADADTVTKRNTIFSNIKDGYFFLLDDDTRFLNNTYIIYKKYQIKQFEGLIFGNLAYSKAQKNKVCLPVPNVDPNKIFADTGMAIAYFKVLDKVKWDWVKLEDDFGNDFLFWSKCYQYFGQEQTIIENEVLIERNYFAPFLRVRRKVWFFSLNFDTSNYFVITFYNLLLKVGFNLRKLLGFKRNPLNRFPYFE